MVNNYINWTKVYSLDRQRGSFKVYISSHTDGYFYAAVLYYTRKGEWSEVINEIHLEMKMENFIDNTEKGVYDQCISWVAENIPGKYTVRQEETKGI